MMHLTVAQFAFDVQGSVDIYQSTYYYLQVTIIASASLLVVLELVSK